MTNRRKECFFLSAYYKTHENVSRNYRHNYRLFSLLLYTPMYTRLTLSDETTTRVTMNLMTVQTTEVQTESEEALSGKGEH